MIIQVDMAGATPIYVQLRNQIVLGIGRGELRTGQGLPTVRQMAEELGVNMMTVSKAYTLLKNEGYIEIDRRHGAKVYPVAQADDGFRQRLEQELTLLVAEASIKGLDFQQFTALSRKLFDRMVSSSGKGE